MSVEYLPAHRPQQLELVLLHGWGSSREIWRPLLAHLRPWANITLLDLPGCSPGLDTGRQWELAGLLEAILAVAPRQAVYIGWSLGGQLALELATRHVERVAAVVTLCSNPRFVAQRRWPGMDAAAFASFSASYQSDPVATLQRFGSLQARGARQPRTLLRQLHGRGRGTPGPELEAGLALLQRLDQRAQLAQLQQPQLHLLAANDGLVPAALEPALVGLLPAGAAARVHVLPGASHLALLDCADRLAREIHDFLAGTGLPGAGMGRFAGPDKREVASSFSRAATSYDAVAKLQRDVGTRLLAYLDPTAEAPAVVLDLGCGTGSFRPALQARCPGASYIGLDLAPGMVGYARAHGGADSSWLLGDAEALPLATDSVDLVFSSLAIQWCHRPEQVFAEIGRVLKPGGRCVFSTLGPDTLKELRQSWAAVDAHQHVNDFLPLDTLRAAAAMVPGLQLNMKTERHTMYYQRVGELLAELKGLGAHNMNRGRPAGLTTRGALQGMLQAYERWRCDDQLPASYEVFFGEATKI